MITKELEVVALKENLYDVQTFVESQLEEIGCPMRAMMQIGLAVEEIFINIASYAYGHEEGLAKVRIEVSENPVTVSITFIDQGKPYDPLARQDPDVTLAAEKRRIGGLGIFLTKNTMDDVIYQYKEGSNILTLKKKL